MDKKFYMADSKQNLSFQDMVEKVEPEGNKITYYYNKNYICGKTVQYEIFAGIWVVYHDVVLRNSELFHLEENGILRINYCIYGRCELDSANQKVFYVGPGDFVVTRFANEQHKHNFPLGNYRGISITTTAQHLDVFLQTIFSNTKITSSMLIDKIQEHGKYMLLHDPVIQGIMKEFMVAHDCFWQERATLKFAELILLLMNDDIDALEVKGKYFDKQLTNKVKFIKKEVTENIEQYHTIEEIAKQYNISSRSFAECFKEIYGKTYYAFIKDFRIKKAAGMICSTQQTIGEIAITVGYQNASKFSKVFFDSMGVTPLNFRKNNTF